MVDEESIASAEIVHSSDSPHLGESTSPLGGLTLAQYNEQIVGSEIGTDVALENDVRGILHYEAARLGFKGEQARDGLLLSGYWDHAELPNIRQLRPWAPRYKDGKPVKYELPADTHVALSTTRGGYAHTMNPRVPLIFTEGLKKVLAIATKIRRQGLRALRYRDHAIAEPAVINLLGVRSWMGPNEDGGTGVPLAQFREIPFRGKDETTGDTFRRLVILAFDGDAMTNPDVHDALTKFRAYLIERGAEIAIMYLPATDGVDDFFAKGHTLQDALNLCEPMLRPLDTSNAILSLAEMHQLPDVPWQIDQLLTADGLTILYGAPGTFKSFLALDWLACIAGGIPDWFGIPIRTHGPTLHIYSEGRAGIGQRARAVTRVRHLDPATTPLFSLPSAVDVTEPPTVDTLIAEIRAKTAGVAPVCIVIDTLARNLVGDENQQVDVGKFIAGCDRLRTEFGCQVLVIHHLNAEGKVRGSTTLPGAADTLLELVREGDALATTLRVKKQKDGEQGTTLTIHLRKEGDSLVVSGVEQLGQTAAAEPDPLTEGQQAVFGLLAQARSLKFGEWVAQTAEAYEVSKATVAVTRTKAGKAKLIWMQPDRSWALTPLGVEYATKHGWSSLV